MSFGPIHGLVLAGGRSRRFGGADKACVSLGGEPLWERALTRLAPQVDAIAISSNDPTGRLASDLRKTSRSWRSRTGDIEPGSIVVLPDLITGHLGPLAGIHAGLSTWPDHYLVTVAVDLPFMPPDLVERLAAALVSRRCAYASDGTRHALALLWNPGAAAELGAFLERGGRSVHEWLAAHGDPALFAAPGDAGLFVNINTPEDLEIAERRLRKTGGDVSG